MYRCRHGYGIYGMPFLPWIKYEIVRVVYDITSYLILLMASSTADHISTGNNKKPGQSWHSTGGMYHSSRYITFLDQRRWEILQIHSYACCYEGAGPWTISYICSVAGFQGSSSYGQNWWSWNTGNSKAWYMKRLDWFSISFFCRDVLT